MANQAETTKGTCNPIVLATAAERPKQPGRPAQPPAPDEANTTAGTKGMSKMTVSTLLKPAIRALLAVTLVALLATGGCGQAAAQEATTHTPAASLTSATPETGPIPTSLAVNPADGPEAATPQAASGNETMPRKIPVLGRSDSGPGPKSARPDSGGAAQGAGPASPQPQERQPEGTPHTWRDGDRTMTVMLQQDLTVGQGGKIQESPPRQDIGSRGVPAGKNGGGDDRLPVFRSHSGTVMTLPGGVLLALDPGWDRARVYAFFSRNSIDAGRVSELDYLPNGFFIETEPGFPSLDLANTLAEQDGVTASSPNWSREVETK